MEVLGQPNQYQYTPQWSTQNQLSGAFSPYPTSSAGDLLSTMVPDYSSINTRFSGPSTTRVETFAAAVTLAEGTSAVPSVVSLSAPRNRGLGYSSRPSFGRSRSYPNGRLGMSICVKIELLLRHQYRSTSMAVKFPNVVFSENTRSNKQFIQTFNHKSPNCADYEFIDVEWSWTAFSYKSSNFPGAGPVEDGR
jgi:hypothetical protein